MLELFDYVLSTDAYKARLVLSFLGVAYRTRNVEFFPAREHHAEWFLSINPRGELPVLLDDGVYIEDAQAILVHLATKFDPSGTWYPHDNATFTGQMSMWLAFADALTLTAAAARLHDGFGYGEVDIDEARAGAHELLRTLDEHIWFAEQQGFDWLCPRPHPSVADVACFPDVALAEEGGVDLDYYRAVRRWMRRVRRLPNFCVMPGILPA